MRVEFGPSQVFRGTTLEALLATACLLMLPALAVAARRELASLARGRQRRELGLLALVALSALLVRLHDAAAPFQHRVYFDEWDYLENARSHLLRHRDQVCTWGSPDGCRAWATSVNSKAGQSALIAFAFALGGVGDRAPMLLTLALSVSSVALAFLLAAALFPRSRAAPLSAALMLAALPLHVRFSSTTASEPMSLFLGGLCVASALACERSPSRAAAWLTAMSFASAVSVRYEGVLLAAPLGLVLRRKARTLAAPALAAAALSAAFVSGWGLSFAEYGYTPVTAQPGLIAASASASARLWSGEGHHPLLLTALALAGALVPPSRRSRGVLLAWLAPVVLLYALHRLPMDRWGQDRHMLQGYLPLVALAAGGLGALEGAASRRGALLAALLACSAAALSLGILSSCPGQEGCSPPVERELAFARAHGRERPECIVAAPTPVFVTWEWRRGAIYFERVGDVEGLLREGQCALFFEDLFCEPRELFSIYEGMPKVCAEYRERFSLRTLAEDADGPWALRLSELSPKAGTRR